MTNEEHLTKLKQGVEGWNQWRKRSHFQIKPDLTQITKTDLCKAHFDGAILSRVNLSRVDLSGVDLSKVDLFGANLSGANLSGTNLSEANLSGAKLVGANLSGAILSEAILSEAKLIAANLSGAYLWKSNLSEANLSEAKLIAANLIEANLSKASLSKADLSRAYLNEAKLIGANLGGAKLNGANLVATQALGTNFEKATLTEACIEDWNINSDTNLDDVICQYVYLQNCATPLDDVICQDFCLQDEKQKRLPDDGEELFAPGEFTRVFKTDAENRLTSLIKTFRKSQPNYSYDLVLDRPDSRKLLVEALNNCTKRLILVCPWLCHHSIQSDILKKLKVFLRKGGCIDIGWGNWNDISLRDVKLCRGSETRQQLLTAVSKQGSNWKYDVLESLEELEQEYPNQFKLKLLGTHEKYLVWANSNNSWAMMGSHNFLTSSAINYDDGTPSRERELGLKTNDPHIVSQLIERFDIARNWEE